MSEQKPLVFTVFVEVLRQPLEDKVVTISRAQGSVTFPANFMLVAAMNPCPCGFASDPLRQCTCTPSAISRYRKRISGPLKQCQRRALLDNTAITHDDQMVG